MSMSALPWAVHISDGVLSWPFLAGGFVLVLVLVLIAAWRVREEEIPRIALLTAAFFVTSSIHVKLGPTSGHLLLNGLVGVLLGWRAPLAVLIGVTLQALLIPHGGLTTIGVNALTETVPALLAGALFWLLYPIMQRRLSLLRELLVMASAILWGGCLVFGVVLVVTNPLPDVIKWSADAGLVIAVENLAPARAALLHPITLGCLGLLALVCVLVERAWSSAPEFALGTFLGMLSVLATVLLTGLVLLADGADRWGTFVSAVFVVHLPIALLEGLILGCTLGFLARVKPEMLTSHAPAMEQATEPPVALANPGAVAPPSTAMLLLLSLGALLLSGQQAHAHRLEADYTVDRAKRQVRIESWYETDDPPKEARARVLRSDGSILAEGPLDDKGSFVFSYEKSEPLRVRITAPGGHAKELKISDLDLQDAEQDSETSPGRSPARSPADHARSRDLLIGLGFLFSLSSLLMGWLNSRKLRKLAEMIERRESAHGL